MSHRKDSNDSASWRRKPLTPGDWVVDLNQHPDDRDPAVVINRPEVTADQYHIVEIDATVAEANPDYPADSEAITIAFVDVIEKKVAN